MSERSEKSLALEETSSRLSDASTLAPTKEDDLQCFTATGRPMPKYHSSGLSNVPADFTPMAVQNLPWKFTDDDLISVPIPVSVDSAAAAADQVESKGWGSRLKQAMKGKRSPPKMKMVKMTRGEYLKYWARDEQGNYIGTEPEGMGEKLWKNK